MSPTEASIPPSAPDSLMVVHRLSPWCFSRAKRALDVLCSITLILASLPLIAILAVLIKCTSPGPALFRQKRLGKNGCQFQLLKFRSMHHGQRALGLGLTRHGDPRITRVGRFLRKWKLDELPQLFNVLRGQMSLVGPRPDLPEYFQGLRNEQRLVLSLSPGITGAASLRFRNEEMLLAEVAPEQLESFYVNTLLPQKIELELEYARGANLFSDSAMLLRTAAAVLH
jgi:lipopolysaccharide/colanic/teichoic acid biosynthesis glycosyltransferase